MLILFDMFVVYAMILVVCAVLILLLLVCCFVFAGIFPKPYVTKKKKTCYVYDFIT